MLSTLSLGLILLHGFFFAIVALMPNAKALAIVMLPLSACLGFLWYSALGPGYGHIGNAFLIAPLFLATVAALCGFLARVRSLRTGLPYLQIEDRGVMASWLLISFAILGLTWLS